MAWVSTLYEYHCDAQSISLLGTFLCDKQLNLLRDNSDLPQHLDVFWLTKKSLITMKVKNIIHKADTRRFKSSHFHVS